MVHSPVDDVFFGIALHKSAARLTARCASPHEYIFAASLSSTEAVFLPNSSLYVCYTHIFGTTSDPPYRASLTGNRQGWRSCENHRYRVSRVTVKNKHNDTAPALWSGVLS